MSKAPSVAVCPGCGGGCCCGGGCYCFCCCCCCCYPGDQYYPSDPSIPYLSIRYHSLTLWQMGIIVIGTDRCCCVWDKNDPWIEDNRTSHFFHPPSSLFLLLIIFLVTICTISIVVGSLFLFLFTWFLVLVLSWLNALFCGWQMINMKKMQKKGFSSVSTTPTSSSFLLLLFLLLLLLHVITVNEIMIGSISLSVDVSVLVSIGVSWFLPIDVYSSETNYINE